MKTACRLDTAPKSPPASRANCSVLWTRPSVEWPRSIPGSVIIRSWKTKFCRRSTISSRKRTGFWPISLAAAQPLSDDTKRQQARAENRRSTRFGNRGARRRQSADEYVAGTRLHAHKSVALRKGVQCKGCWKICRARLQKCAAGSKSVRYVDIPSFPLLDAADRHRNRCRVRRQEVS